MVKISLTIVKDRIRIFGAMTYRHAIQPSEIHVARSLGLPGVSKERFYTIARPEEGYVPISH